MGLETFSLNNFWKLQDKTEDEILEIEHNWFLESWEQYGKREVIDNIESALKILVNNRFFTIEFDDGNTASKLIRGMLTLHAEIENTEEYILESSGILIFFPTSYWIIENIELVKPTLIKLKKYLIADVRDIALYRELLNE